MILSRLSDDCVLLNDRISDYLKALDWDKPIEKSSVHTALMAFTKCYYDVAFNQQQAIRAISLRGLLLLRSRNSHMLAEWLEAACARWQIRDASIGTWCRRFDSVVEQTTSSSAFEAFHQDEIRREALNLLARFLPRDNINEDVDNQLTSLLQIQQIAHEAIKKKPERDTQLQERDKSEYGKRTNQGLIVGR